MINFRGDSDSVKKCGSRQFKNIYIFQVKRKKRLTDFAQ